MPRFNINNNNLGLGLLDQEDLGTHENPVIDAQYIFNDMPAGLVLTRKNIFTDWENKMFYFDGHRAFPINDEIYQEYRQLDIARDNELHHELMMHDAEVVGLLFDYYYIADDFQK